MLPEHLSQLENRIDTLIALCERLQEENAALRRSQALLMQERSDMVKHQQQAGERLEALMSMLQTAE